MDKLAERLRHDADAIDARVSPELDARIEASLRAVTPSIAPAQPPPRRWPVWLGGAVAAGIALVAVVSVVQRPAVPVSSAPIVADGPASIPLDLDAEATELVTPLSRELDNLQADLRKAEQILRDDLGL